MSQSEVKKTLNRMNNLTLQEKRGFREIIDSMYTDLADTTAFVGGDYYQSRYNGSATNQIDNTLGYETGLIRPMGTASLTSSGLVGTTGLAPRATTAAATAQGGTSTEHTTAAPHGLVVGDWVTMSGFAGDEEYNGVYQVSVVGSTTTFEVVEPFTSNLTGLVTKPSIITCATAGTYMFHHQGAIESTAVSGSGNFRLFHNDSIQSSKGRHIMDTAAANTETPYAYSWVITLAVGDVVGMAISSVNWGATVILRSATVDAIQVA
jgi:hypothetical protein